MVNDFGGRKQAMNYWLLKTEPDVFSWDDLRDSPDRTTQWEGVRNYQARNFLKEMKTGDLGFFYHSVVKPQAIHGIVKIVRPAYPDPTQFDTDSEYFDPGSAGDNPRWFLVDVQYQREIKPAITREELKSVPELKKMVLLNNTRLSVQPVTAEEWKIILHLRSIPEKFE